MVLPTSAADAEVSSVPAAFSSAIAVRFCTTSTTFTLAWSSCSVFSAIVRIPSMDFWMPSFTSWKDSSVLATYSSCLPITCWTSFMVSTDFSESAISWLIMSPICLADSFDCSASFWIWDATTAKPLPCSPARAASMEAFKDRRFVSSAISVMISVASLIFNAEAFVVFVCS